MNDIRYSKLIALLFALLMLLSCYDSDTIDTALDQESSKQEVVYVSEAFLKTEEFIGKIDNGELFDDLNEGDKSDVRREFVGLSLVYKNAVVTNNVSLSTLNAAKSTLAEIGITYKAYNLELSYLTAIQNEIDSAIAILDPPPVAVYEETFATDDFETRGWTVTAEAGTEVWEGDNSYQNVAVSAYNSGEDSNIAWLISPQRSIANDGYLNTEIQTAYWQHNGLSILVSQDYTNDVTAATWTALSATLPTDGDSDYIATGNVDLSAYNGSDIHIAFKYTGSGNSGDTTTYRIKNFRIFEEQ